MQKLIVILLLLSFKIAEAQDLSFSRPGDEHYNEMSNPLLPDPTEWARLKKDINVSFASSNVRYAKEQIPFSSTGTEWQAVGWRNEKISTQILVWTKKNISSVSVIPGKLVSNKGKEIPAGNVIASFVRYVMSDEFEGGCAHSGKIFDSSLVEDPIDIAQSIPVEKNSVQPVWLSIKIPADIQPGYYSGYITVVADNNYKLKISLKVLNHTLPSPDKWKYDLDFWQYPYPIAKVHGVKSWSDEHFNLLRKYYSILAATGQKTITANIIDQPWGYDHDVYYKDPSLVKWTKKTDGSWNYDFSLFDKYISFMKSCGITQRINCYSMLPWDLSFTYFDEQQNKNAILKLEPGTKPYEDFWKPMLEQFRDHLKEKNWFKITAIAMDERPLESMKAIIKLIKSIDPDWKIALATDGYHKEIEEDIFDLSIASHQTIEDSVLAKRKKLGKPTTFYTACVEDHPGPYTFSPPAENAWLAWHAAGKGLTGYLFWAYNTWSPDPLRDARYSHYPSGTFFQIYPGPRTSVRFEKIIEGAQDFEKIRILREIFVKNGSKDNLARLNKLLSSFELKNLDTRSAAGMIEEGKQFLNQF